MLNAFSPEDIDVVILCGGLGMRLREVVKDRPKPMAEIKGRPFLDILIDYAAEHGFKRFILCVGYLGDKIKQYYQGKSGPLTILFSEEREALGTGGALKNAEALIKSDPFLVMNGDSFCRVDLNKFTDFHLSNRASVSMVLVRALSTKESGAVSLGNSKQVTGFNEKVEAQADSFVNAGIYLIEKDVLSSFQANKNFSLEYDFFPAVIGKNFYGYPTSETLTDIGTQDGYRKAKEIFSKIKERG